MEFPICDIHMHLIPGVDDGAAGMEDSLRMLLAAQDGGIRAIFATPHSYAFDRNPEALSAAAQALRCQAARFFPDMALFTGCEVLCDSYQMDSILKNLASGVYPSLNGTRFVLAEFSPWGTAEEACRCLDALRNSGWIPVIAHAERYPWLQNQWNWVSCFRELGCLFQVNAYSLAEEQSCEIREFARALVAKQLADFLGTDAHRPSHRPPRAQAGARWVRETCGEGYAHRLLWDNARQLLMKTE